MKSPLLTVVFLLFAAPALAQTATLSGYIRDSKTKSNVISALVEVISGSDTLRTVSSVSYGTFVIKNVKPGDALIRVTHVSYKPFEKKIKVLPRRNEMLTIELEMATTQIREVTVKADIPLYKMSGDTLIYNAAAIKTLEGDEAAKILEQLPGIIIDNNQISAMGKNVARTYVDGKLLFGDDPMSALLNLTAADVQKIKVYDEYSEYDRRHKRRSARKRRVLDIQTKSKLISATTGHFLASYGTDLEKDNDNKLRDRYGAGLTANFFSEKLRLSANAYTNNVNRTSNRLTDLLNIKSANQPYAENTYAAVGYEQMFGDEKDISPELTADYSYKNAYTRSESYSSREYFPTSEYEQRAYYDSLYRVQRTQTHFAKTAFKWRQFWVNQDFNTSLSRTEGMQHSLSLLDDNRTAVNSDSRQRMRDYTYNASTGWYGSLSKKLYAMTSAKVSLGWNDGTKTWTDSLSTQSLKREYRSAPFGRTQKIEGNFSMDYNISNGFLEAVTLGYGVDYNYEKSRRLRYDIVRGELDIPGSRNFTYDYITHTPLFGMFLGKNNHHLAIRLPVNISIQNQQERLPGVYADRRSFAALLPWVEYLIEMGINTLEFSYTTQAELPSMEQLSRQVDDTNPLYSSAGNPSLKQTYRHRLELQFFLFNQKGGVWTGSVSANFVKNAVTDRSVFYKDGTTLADYDNQPIPAGGTFTTYENVAGKMSAGFSINYAGLQKCIRSGLSVTLGGNYNCTPTFVGDRKNLTRTYTPSLNVRLTSNFSKQIRIMLSSHNTFIYARNNIGDDNRYFRETVGCNVESNFAKRLFLNANYEYSLYQPIGDSGVRNQRNMLNVVAGCKFHKNRGAVSISCYDLLNRSTSFKTSMYSDYVRNGWTPTFGRYWAVNVSYRFNKTKSGAKTSPMRLNDGSEVSSNPF